MKLRPLQDRLLVRRLEEDRQSSGGIIIPDQAAEKSQQGEVVDAGMGRYLDNGEIQPMSVRTGDRVLFGKYAGNEVKVDGEELIVLKEADVYAVLEAAER